MTRGAANYIDPLFGRYTSTVASVSQADIASDFVAMRIPYTPSVIPLPSPPLPALPSSSSQENVILPAGSKRKRTNSSKVLANGAVTTTVATDIVPCSSHIAKKDQGKSRKQILRITYKDHPRVCALRRRAVNSWKKDLCRSGQKKFPLEEAVLAMVRAIEKRRPKDERCNGANKFVRRDSAQAAACPVV